MFIRLLASGEDIPRYWEMIKWVVKEVNEVPDEYFPVYCRKLLMELYNDSMQCWLNVNAETKDIDAIVITGFLYDPMYNMKYLQIHCMYGWKRLPKEDWPHMNKMLVELAKKEGCRYIGYRSRNPKIWEHSLDVGYIEVTRIYAYDVGGR